jgi:regulator of nucleoside diphosphate kinase
MSQNLPQIHISKSDFDRLSALAFHSELATARDLEEELGRAVIVSDSELPEDIVTMDSTIEFKDLDSNTSSMVTLVYPEQVKGEGTRVSILAPVGVALLGLRINDVVEWPVPGGFKRRLKVVSVHEQDRKNE